jgi:hypothetical protein
MGEKISSLNKGQGDNSRNPLTCFEKYKWYFQSECGVCPVNTECNKATLRNRDFLIQKINEAIEREKRLTSAYDIIHPKILNHKYHFLED